MNIDVTFTESTSEIPVKFEDLQIITNGVPPAEVEKLVADGEQRGFNAGTKAEYDHFWDVYQLNGKRVDYTCAFSGSGWTAETFRPKYDLVVYDAYMMFRYCNFQFGTSYDLAQQLEDCGVTLDTSKCYGFMYMFWQAQFDRVPALDCRSADDLGSMFYFSRVRAVDKLILKETGTNTFANCFLGCSYLESISFDGVIGTDISFSNSSLLTGRSVQSIVDHLKDLTGATARTLTFQANVGAKLTETQKAAITAKNWTLVY